MFLGEGLQQGTLYEQPEIVVEGFEGKKKNS